jgi:phage-related protein
MAFGGTVKLTGESEYKKALADITGNLKVLNSEMKVVTSQYDRNDKSTENLTQQNDVLNKKIEEQRKKVEILSKALEDAERETGENSKTSQKWQIELNNAQAELNKLVNNVNENEKAMEQSASATEENAESLDKFGKEADESGKKALSLGDIIKANLISEGIMSGLSALGGAISGIGEKFGAFLELGESTKETQTAMSKLEASFQSAGHDLDHATDTVYALTGVLGDMDRSVEASNLLAKMSKDSKDLDANTRILTGVFAEFGDSIPTEGLAEGMNATAEMGSVQGVLADALEWQGVNLDDYNAKLESMTSAEERASYIQSTLTDLYGESADAYRENNQALIESNEAQLRYEQHLAEMGKMAMPLQTDIKNISSALIGGFLPALEGVMPSIQAISGGFTLLISAIMGGDEGGIAEATTMISEGVTAMVENISATAPKLIEIVGSLLTTIVDVIAENLPKLTTSILSLIPTLISLITSQLPAILDVVLSLIPQLVQALADAIPILLDAVLNIATQVINSLAEILPQVLTTIVGLIPELITTILDALPMLIDAVLSLVLSIVQALPTIIQNLIQALPSIIQSIVSALLSAIPLLLETAIELLLCLVKAIPTIIDALIKALPELINTIITELLDALPLLIDGAIELLMAIITAIPTITEALIVEVPNIVFTIINTLLSQLPNLITGSVELLMGIVKAIPTIVTELARQVPKIITQIVTSLSGGIKQVANVGKNLVSGIWEGISSSMQWIKDKISGWVGDVTSFIKKLFGIASPSKLFKEQIGKNLALGVGEGFGDTMHDVSEDMANAIPTEFDAEIHTTGTSNPASQYDYMLSAFKQALKECKVVMNNREMGAFVTETVEREVFA